MKLLATSDGPASNVFQLGFPETCKRVGLLVREALTKTELKVLNLYTYMNNKKSESFLIIDRNRNLKYFIINYY